MSIQFVIGNSGSGKTSYVLHRLIGESGKHPSQRYIILVPEQFTMSTQRALVTHHPDHSILNIDILSFKRLAYRVFAELGQDQRGVLDDTGKNLVLRKIAGEKAQELSVLKHKIKRPGYIDQVKSLLSEFGQYHISPGELLSIGETEGMPPAFLQKAKDLSILYEAFLEEIKKDYITAEQVLELLAQKIGESAIVKDAVIVFDGFTGFTPLQNEVLLQLFPIAKKLVFTVTMDVGEPYAAGFSETELFAISKRMTNSLLRMAEITHTEVEEPIKIGLSETSRFLPESAIGFLEAHLFRSGDSVFCGPKSDDKADGIEIYRLDDPREELRFCAGHIRRLTMEGLRYGEIAIVCGDLNTYKHYIEEEFLHYDIPIFTDATTELSFSPAIEFLVSLLEIFEKDFSYDSLMHFLRTGLCGLEREDVDLLDRYLYRTGIRGKRAFSEPFTICPGEFSEEELDILNDLRSELYEKLSPADAALGHTVAIQKHTAAVRDVFEAFSVDEQCQSRGTACRERGEDDRAQEYQKIVPMILALFDQMDHILGGDVTDVKEFSDLLRAGFSAVKLGILPPASEGVIIGDIERTRLEHIKVLFFIGAMDGIIPKTGNEAGILSQNERYILKEHQVELAPTQRERAFLQRFYLYQVLTKASRRLILTYPRLDAEGNAAKKSYLLSELLRLFPTLSIRRLDKGTHPGEWLGTRKECEDTLIVLLRRFRDVGVLEEDERGLLQNLLSYLRQTDEQRLEEILEGVFFVHGRDVISSAVMRGLNAGAISANVSRLERYASCAYQYFLQYGLRLKERRESAYATYDIGNLYHLALDLFSEKVNKSGVSWFDLKDSEAEAMMDAAVQEAFESNEDAKLHQSARDAYVLHLMKTTLHRTVWAIRKQVRAGAFEPKGFEVELKEIASVSSLTRELSDGTRLSLNGIIDRYDLSEVDDKVYVKIIDYKSGNKSVDLLSMYYGLQIQLVFYMGTAIEGLQEHTKKTVLPGALLYYHIDNPFVEEGEEAEVEKKLLSALKPKGKILAADDVIRSIDKDFFEGKIAASDVAELKKKADGSLAAASQTLKEDEFSAMIAFVQKKVDALGEQIASGEVPVAPYRLGGKNGCAYCGYRAVCSFEPMLDGYDYRRLREIPKDGILPRMKEELDSKVEEA